MMIDVLVPRLFEGSALTSLYIELEKMQIINSETLVDYHGDIMPGVPPLIRFASDDEPVNPDDFTLVEINAPIDELERSQTNPGEYQEIVGETVKCFCRQNLNHLSGPLEKYVAQVLFIDGKFYLQYYAKEAS